MRIFRLQTASVDDIVGLVRNAVLASHRDETVRLDVDNASNSIVVSGSAAGVEAAATLIAELDGPRRNDLPSFELSSSRRYPQPLLRLPLSRFFSSSCASVMEPGTRPRLELSETTAVIDS